MGRSGRTLPDAALVGATASSVGVTPRSSAVQAARGAAVVPDDDAPAAEPPTGGPTDGSRRGRGPAYAHRHTCPVELAGPGAGRGRRGRHPRAGVPGRGQGRLHRRRRGARRHGRPGRRPRRPPGPRRPRRLDARRDGPRGLHRPAQRPHHRRHPHPVAVGRRIPRGRRRGPGRRCRCLPRQALRGGGSDPSGARPHGEAAGMTGAVLQRATSWGRLHRRPPAVPSHGPFPASALPSTAMFAVAAVLLATGILPVRVGELVLAGLVLAFLGTLVTWLTVTGDSAMVVSLAHLGAVALLLVGTGSAPVLFLLLRPVLMLVMAGGRRGVLVAALGTAGVLVLPGLLPGATPPAELTGALLLGPVAVALGGLAVSETSRVLGRQAADIDRLRAERSTLLAQAQTRADELDVATRMLAARAQTMTSVIDAVTEQSIIGTDRDGIIRVWNPGAEKLLGLRRADVVRKRSIIEFHLAEELEAAAESCEAAPGLAALVHAAQRNGSDVRDWTYVAADGQERTVAVAVTPRTDDRGLHTGWNFVGTDMTEARATERMKDQFVSLISHELRTPLTSIRGYLELVLEDEDQRLTDEHRRYLTTVERNADRLWRLVGALLFPARAAAGRFTLQPADVDLATVVRAAEETVRVTAGSAGVELTVDVPEEGLVVPGDAVRLGQACDNLVSNAVKFTPSGGRVTLSLRPGWQTPDGDVFPQPRPGAVPVARLSVSDTGIGIPSGEQRKMFTRFFRASTAQRNAIAGVGLGLAITKAITTAHGGTLDLVSAEGEGTTFTLTLPR